MRGTPSAPPLSSTSTPLDTLAAARAASAAADSSLRATIRSSNLQVARDRDTLLHSVLSNNPSGLYKAVNSSLAAGTPSLHQLQHIYRQRCA